LNVDVNEIGRALKVTSILEGSVRKSGDRLRINIKLVDIQDGFPVWAEQYDRKLEDVFELQEEISRAVVEKLRVTFAPLAPPSRNQPGSGNVRAFEHYLKGRYFWNKRTEEALKLS